MMIIPRFRFLFIPSGIGFSHLGRLLLIADLLRRWGHQVVFAYGGRHGDQLLRLNYRCLPVTEINLPDDPDFAGPILERYSGAIIEQCIEDELGIIEKIRPDVIVSDLRPSALISARLAGKPCVTLRDAYMTDYFDLTSLVIDKQQYPHRHKAADWFISKIVNKQKERLANNWREVARKHGLRGYRSLYDFFRGDLNLVADLPAFAPLSRPPDNFHYVGPLIWEGQNDSASEPLPECRSGERMIYVSVGNTGGKRLLDLVVDAFHDRPQVQLIVTTGPYIDPGPYTGWSHIHVRPFISGTRIMRSSDLVIHFGGTGTTYQCLGNGLPMIVVPFNNGQKITARLIRRHGVGIPLSIAYANTERLLIAVRHLVQTPDFKDRAQHFQRMIQPLSGPRIAAKHTINLAQNTVMTGQRLNQSSLPKTTCAAFQAKRPHLVNGNI